MFLPPGPPARPPRPPGKFCSPLEKKSADAHVEEVWMGLDKKALGQTLVHHAKCTDNKKCYSHSSLTLTINNFQMTAAKSENLLKIRTFRTLKMMKFKGKKQKVFSQIIWN